MRRSFGSVVAGMALVGAIAVQPAGAAQAPTVTTGNATNVTQQSATLHGTVNPRGQATTYRFDYGTTKAYGRGTTTQSAGTGTKGTAVSFGITGLAAGATYHYRLVANNASGTVLGKDRAFTTARIPTAITIDASPNPSVSGSSTLISGALSGSGSVGRGIALQQKPYPYTAPFAQVGAGQATDAAGHYAFRVSPLVKTIYRVVTTTGASQVSRELLVGVRPFTTYHLSDSTPRRGQLVRFYGSVVPPHTGTLVAIQKKSRSGRYVSVAHTRTTPASSARSAYSRRLRLYTSGRFRILVVTTDGDHDWGAPASRYISVH